MRPFMFCVTASFGKVSMTTAVSAKSLCLLIWGELPSQRTGLPRSLFSFCLFIYVTDSKMGACPVRHDAGISHPCRQFSNILVMGVNMFGKVWVYSKLLLALP